MGTNNIKWGWLLTFSFLFLLAMSVRIYAEVRKCREGLQEEKTDNDKKQQQQQQQQQDIENDRHSDNNDLEYGMSVEEESAEFSTQSGSDSRKRDLVDVSAAVSEQALESPRSHRSKSPATSRGKSPAAPAPRRKSPAPTSRSKSPTAKSSRSKSPAAANSTKSRSQSPGGLGRHSSRSKSNHTTTSTHSNKSSKSKKNKTKSKKSAAPPYGGDELSITSFDVTGTTTSPNHSHHGNNNNNNNNGGIDMLNNIITTTAMPHDTEKDDNAVNDQNALLEPFTTTTTTTQLQGDKWEAFSETKGDKQASELRKYHKAADWEKLREFFHRIRRRIIERQHYIMLLVKWIQADWPQPIQKDTTYCDYLDAWNEAEPENLQCNIIRLETWIAWAWHGRTQAFAHQIPAERVDLYYTRMDAAAAELARILQIPSKKQDALIYAAAMKIATGRNDDQTVVQQYLQSVQSSNDPANYNFHIRALEFFCEKWHGSHTEMFDYARWITGQLPDGHPVWILIPLAHFEKASMLESVAQRMAYWHAQHDEIVTAYEKALRGPWETTVNPDVSPACKKLDAVVRNWFVYALGKCRASELAQIQARVIGKRPLTELPCWDEKYTYKKHVKALGFQVD